MTNMYMSTMVIILLPIPFQWSLLAIQTGMDIIVIIVKYFFGALDIFGDVSYNALQ